MDRIAAFDVGSTNLRYALGRTDGTFDTPTFEEATNPAVLGDQLVNKLTYLEAVADETIDAVCMATTGLVDADQGIIRHFDTREGFDDLENVDVRSKILENFDAPVYIENDANAAALGEYHYGIGDEYNCLIHISMGTGIGAGIVEEGHLFRGQDGQAGEVGMIPVAEETRFTASGVPSAWEAYCSGEGIKQFVRARLENETRQTALSQLPVLDAQHLFETAQGGDELAQEYVNDIGRYNSRGIASLVNAFNPGIITLGGSVVLNNPDQVLKPIKANLKERVLVSSPKISISPLGEDIALVGALALHGDGGD